MQRLFRGFVKIAVLKAQLLKAPTPTLYMYVHKSTLALYPASSVFVLITAKLGRRFFIDKKKKKGAEAKCELPTLIHSEYSMC